VFDCKNPDDQRLLESAPSIDERLCDECRAHFDEVQRTLKELGVEYVISPRLVRGLDYYTRTTFEFQSASLEAAQSTVCAGGRYDGLSEAIGGPRLPGIGFGSGIERVLLASEAQGGASEAPALTCFVVPLGAEERSEAVGLVRALREGGISADLAYGARGLKAALKHADRMGARHAALIGAKEREAGVVTMRDMASGAQEEVPIRAVPSWLRGRA
jgi:histidyl-tRNA synthetase